MRWLSLLTLLAGCAAPAWYQAGAIHIDARQATQWSDAQLLFIVRHEEAHRYHWLRGHRGELAADCYAAKRVAITRAEFDEILSGYSETPTHPAPDRRWREIRRCRQ